MPLAFSSATSVLPTLLRVYPAQLCYLRVRFFPYDDSEPLCGYPTPIAVIDKGI